MYLLTPGDVRAAGAALAEAFADDPLWLVLYPDPARRRALLARCERALAAVSVSQRCAYGAGPGPDGVALWELRGLPSARPSLGARLQLLSLGLSSLPLAARRARPAFAAFAQLHARHAPGPHFYLQTLGVRPAAQGRGLASQLVRPMLAEAARRGLPTYLETVTEANVPRYERLGLRCVEERAVPEVGLRVWALLRP